ncbi:hypothetical protein FJT64_020556 [Amphibalanus amphitrite]|uniref:Chitin-binding type-2 domain-containing protein n=1 Tax=Amphibalanus amphitrite TaxID=1232801 RepID=A0A6A4WWG9_AMPAM|nr:hypothetical protein FJT64_020556 [Amphibalanus amphitrite]
MAGDLIRMSRLARTVTITAALVVCCAGQETSTAASEASTASTAASETSNPDTSTSGSKKQDPRFTGDPQIDWQFDPNYPRELRGYNMTGYPFFSRVPKKIKYDCKDRIDGFYANIEYKCQVYHHCLYGIRQDFVCANYTAFDMRTFICQFVNLVDCENSDSYTYRFVFRYG